MTAGKADPQMRWPHLESEVQRTERIAERAVEERLLAVWIVFRPGGRRRRAGSSRRELAVREKAPVGCQQAAAGRRVMARRAPRVLLGEKHRFSGCRRCNKQNRDHKP